MKKIFPGTMSLIGSILLLLFLFIQFSFIYPQKDNAGSFKLTPPELPSEINFAGEQVPLVRWDVKERLDRELLINYYSHANILFLLKMSNRYFPILSERLKANGIPDDFKYLCIAESNLVSTAISPSNAVSFWQFLGGTAPGFGLKVNSEVDERYNLEKATDAACRYLQQAYSKFGSWTAAAASYNCGQAGYSSRANLQRTKNYYDLLLPEETNRYIFRILAFKHLLENAKQLGFELSEEDKYQPVPFREVKVENSIMDLTEFAITNGTTYKMLRLMNPWVRGNSLTVSNSNFYHLKLPQQ